MSYFKELGIFDRPFIPLTVKIHGKETAVRVRGISAKEQDEIEALHMDEYGRALMHLKEGTGGDTSEFQRVEIIYQTKSARELVDQLIGTLQDDIMSRALEISGLDPRQEIAIAKDLPPDEQESYMKERNERLEDARKLAEAELRTELLAQSVEELSTKMAKVNINLKALTSAREVMNQAAVFYAYYRPDEDQRIFDTVEQVAEELSTVTITELAATATRAINSDIPFESPVEPEPNKQPSSRSTSAEVTKAGGKRTTTTRGNSKSSSTPA